MTPRTPVNDGARPRARAVPTRTSPELGPPNDERRAAEPPLLLTNDEAAAMLNIGRTTLYQLVWSGKLTPVRIGRSVRFTRNQLRKFVADLANDS